MSPKCRRNNIEIAFFEASQYCQYGLNMFDKKRKARKQFWISNFDRKLLMRVKLYAFNKQIYIYRAFEELCTKGLLYDAEHELRTMQGKTLAKSTNFFAKILYLAKLEAEAKKTKDYVIVKENKGSFSL